ncbi:MAG: extracellular solute-binding protein [Lachnospiraceae bacterium]|nr:extracellular solute-binding protein [Lachnospiraceae bacterium]
MRRFRVILVLLLCMIPLSACHGSRERSAFELPESFDESREYELSFWAKNDTNITQTRIYEQAIADFQALYPNIRVNMRLYTDYGKIYNDVITNIATDTTPNVCITYPDHIATYLEGADTVLALDKLMEDERYGFGGSELRFAGPGAEGVIPDHLKECMIGGEYYALPFMRSTEACYINADMVRALGYEVPDVLSWDYIWEVSEAACKKDTEGNFAVNGQNVLIPFIYKSSDNMMIQYLKQAGAPYSDAYGSVDIFNEETESFLKEIAGHTAKGAFSTFKISGYPGNFLNAEQCIFAIDSTAGATWMGGKAAHQDIAADKLKDFDIQVRPVPQLDVNAPQMISQGPSLCVFQKNDPQEVLAAWLFAQFLLDDSVQIAYSETEGYVPVTVSARQNPEYLDYLSRSGEDNDQYYSVKIDAAKLLLANTENTFVTPVFNGSAPLRNAAGAMIDDVVKATRRKQTVDDAYIDKLYSDMISLYRLDQKGKAAGDVNTPLPAASKALLAGLCLAWAGIIAVWLKDRLKKR